MALVAAVTVAVSTAADVASPSLRPAAAAPVAGGLGFTALAAPCRVADTRSGGGALAPDSTRSFQVGGTGSLAAQGGNPAGCGVPDGAGAVEVAVTAVGPTGNGFLRAFAAGDAVPNATFVSYTSGISITNTGTVALAAAGTQDLSVRNFGGTTQVVVDVLGFYSVSGTAGYVALAAPCRAVDTRLSASGPLTSGQGADRNVQIGGTGAAFAAQGGTAGGCGVPDGVVAAEISLTAVAPVGTGFLRAGPNTGAPPAATVVNYTDAISMTNTGAVALGNAATTDLSLKNFGTQTHVVVDVLGYFTAGGGSRYQTVQPCRAADTRGAGGPMATGTTRLFQVGGSRTNFVSQGASSGLGCGVPQRAAGVVASLTAVAPGGAGFARAFPSGTAANGTFLNFTSGRSITNTGVLPLARGGLRDLAVKTFAAPSNFVVDVLGYFEPTLEAPNALEDVAAGNSYTCAVAVFATVRCWGVNSVGQLGNATTTSRVAPAQVAELSDAVSVVAGTSHTCATTTNGDLKCWGAGTDGQVGNAILNNFTLPQTASGGQTLQATGGGRHTCQITVPEFPSTVNRTECWGAGASGQLGDGAGTDNIFGTQPTGMSGALQVSAGEFHTCAVVKDFTVRCWGSNSNGQLGDGTTFQRNAPVPVAQVTGVVQVAAGKSHTCALLRDATVKCWGSNQQRQAVGGNSSSTVPPSTVPGLTDVVQVAAGGNHTCALLDDGTAKCWGSDVIGQLGDGANASGAVPVAVSGLTNAVGLSAGGFHTCAVRTDGTAKCWGANASGQLGDGTTTGQPTPVALAGTTGTVGISIGESSACAVQAVGTVKCWGSNSNGQLGDGTTASRATAAPVVGLAGAVQVVTGGFHSCALIVDGTARCWGERGLLGVTSPSDSSTPVVVTGLSGAVELSTGANSTCARLADRSLRCWGDNRFGQLGDGTTVDRATPVAVPPSTSTSRIAVGTTFACSTFFVFGVKCWGDNGFGQLGDGTTTSQTSPVLVTGLPSAVGVATGDLHSCAVLADGTARCWGYNADGEVGDGTTTLTRPTPTAVTGLAGAVQIGAGYMHSCAVLGAGTMKCWGENNAGALGDGTTTNRSTATAVGGLTAVTQLSTGDRTTCVVLGNGSAKCWGVNFEGQLGDGTTTNRLVPVLVSGL